VPNPNEVFLPENIVRNPVLCKVLLSLSEEEIDDMPQNWQDLLANASGSTEYPKTTAGKLGAGLACTDDSSFAFADFLGQGSYAAVFESRHTAHPSIRTAVKAQVIAKSQTWKQFVRPLTIQARLDKKYAVQIFSWGIVGYDVLEENLKKLPSSLTFLLTMELGSKSLEDYRNEQLNAEPKAKTKKEYRATYDQRVKVYLPIVLYLLEALSHCLAKKVIHR